MMSTAAARRRRQQGPWSESRQFGAGTAAVLFLGSVWVGVPIGVGLYLFVACMAALWPPMERWPEEGQQRSALLMKTAARRLFLPKPKDSWFGGTGHPSEPERSWIWPTRPSAFAAAGVASLVAYGMWFGGAFIPWAPWNARAILAIRLWPLNMPALFMLIQGFAAASRQKDPADPAPAAVLSREHVAKTASNAVPAAAVAGVTAAGLLLMAMVKFGLDVAPALIGLVGVGGALVTWMAFVAHASTEQFRLNRQRRAEWDAQWMSVLGGKGLPPVFRDFFELPVPQQPTHLCASFALQLGGDWRQYLSALPKLVPALGTEQIILTPWQQEDHEGNLVVGTQKRTGFYLRWAVPGALPERPHLQLMPNGADDQTRDFVITSAFHRAFEALKMEAPVLVSVASLVTGENPDEYLYETLWRIPGAVTPEQIADQTQALADMIGAPWLRVSRSTIASGAAAPLPGDTCSIVYGMAPEEVSICDPVEPTRHHLDRLHWDGWFRASKVLGADGAVPRLLSRELATTDPNLPEEERLQIARFAMPPGLSLERMRDRVSTMQASSGYGYMEVESTERADEAQVLFGNQDPLAKMYLFKDYALRGRQDGEACVEWVVGVGADGEPLIDSFDSDNPHLFVAGASGMGKSVVITSMLCQLMLNNSPDDLALWLIEPKVDLHAFSNVEHVRRFVSQQTPAPSLYAAAADALEEVCVEMDRRYALMNDPKRPEAQRPKKLAEARHIAELEGPPPHGGKHEFDWPVIIVVHEEVSETLRPPTIKEQRDDHNRVLGALDRLARLGRAAGIHLVIATQYPTREALGGAMTLKNQCRRIGLGVNNVIASQVVIDQPGLEALHTPGRGMAAYKNAYRHFRGLFLRKPGKQNPDEPDDLATVLDALPRHGGGGHFAPAGPTADRFAPPPIPDDAYADADDPYAASA